jgi:formylglycine-generating enzyme required for sulfatase activity
MAEAIHQGLASRPENRFDDIIAFEQSMHQGGGVSLPGFDIQKLAIPVAIMVGILLIGGLLGPGAVDLKNLLPMSQEEISRKKGLVVKSLGEIKNYQKRLDNGRKKLDSDVRDAERNDNANLQALRHWQTLTTTTIFDGDDLAELEGQLAMAELLLKENEFVAAQQGMDSVKEGYKQLWLKFNLAEKLYDAEHKAKEAQARWQKRKNTYKLTDLPEVATAQANEAQAAAQAQQGHFSEALRLWRQAEHDWAQIYSSADEKVVALDQQRKDREAELAERKRKAADAKRLAAIEVKRKEADAKAWESVKKATKYRTGRTVIPYRLYLENPDHRDYRQEAEQAIKTIEARIKAAVNSIDKSMVVIPAGSFQMGCVSGFACSDYEFPVHKVALSRFLIGSTEVTDEQWIACALAGACHFPPFHKEGRGQYPIANVSFKDITKQFIPWLNKITGKTYRLPSESEWEYAARAGSQTAFFTGTCVSSDQANYDASFGSNGSDWNKKGNCNEGLKRRGTIPVASFPPNAFGLYDTMGNVAELTADCFNKELFADYHGVPTDGSALTSGYCYYRVVRGGSYMDNARWVRSAKRNYKTPKTATISLGFRLSRDD